MGDGNKQIDEQIYARGSCRVLGLATVRVHKDHTMVDDKESFQGVVDVYYCSKLET